MKLQKLIYLGHGYSLALRDAPLIRDSFEAWKYGPVVPDIYREFKYFGSDVINALATEMDWDAGKYMPVPAPDDADADRLINFVWKNFGHWEAVSLSELSHRQDWAWAKVREQYPRSSRSPRIDNDLIKKDFLPYVTPRVEA